MSDRWILLIDPFQNLLNAYRMVLEEEKYHVETAANVNGAFQKFTLRHFSVLITEYLPPFEETHRMIQGIKQYSPETYILLVTNALIDEKTYEKLLEAGVDDLFLKPYSPEKILAHIKKGFRQKDFILRKLELEKQSLLDPVAQKIEQFIFNSLYFKKCFRQELKRTRRHQHLLSIILFEIPNKITSGESLDEFYIELLKTIRSHIREEDTIGKENGSYGIILPETDEAGSHALAWRLLNLFQNTPSLVSTGAFHSIVGSISLKTYTYPDQFLVPPSLRSVLEEIR
jgi:DNA-binding response OmpR family regulator